MNELRKQVTITFTGEIDAENYYVLEEDLNLARKYGKNVTLFFSTHGGQMDLSENIIDLINDYPFELEVRCYGYLFSAGLLIVSEIEKPIKIGDNCISLAHLPSIALESRNSKKKTGFETYMIETEDKYNEYYLKNFKHVMTEEEIQFVMDGEDVVIEAERLRKIIKNPVER